MTAPAAAALKVRAAQCATCIYRSDSPLDLAALEAEASDGHGGFARWRACHSHHAVGSTVRAPAPAPRAPGRDPPHLSGSPSSPPCPPPPSSRRRPIPAPRRQAYHGGASRDVRRRPLTFSPGQAVSRRRSAAARTAARQSAHRLSPSVVGPPHRVHSPAADRRVRRPEAGASRAFRFLLGSGGG